MKYIFDKELKSGTYRSKLNDNILLVDIDGKIEKCYYLWYKCVDELISESDVAGKEIQFLLSEKKSPLSKIKYVVEVVIFDENTSFGVNDHKISKYIDYFLMENHLKDIVDVRKTKKKFKQGDLNIDFQVNDDMQIYLKIPTHDHLVMKDFAFFKQIYKDIRFKLKSGYKVKIFNCTINDINRTLVPKGLSREKVKALSLLRKFPIEFWQINLNVDKHGVSLDKYFLLETN